MFNLKSHNYLLRYRFFMALCLVFHTGLKAMVSQGVKNPLIDLTALDDKSLDEVSSWQKNPNMPLPPFIH